MAMEQSKGKSGAGGGGSTPQDASIQKSRNYLQEVWVELKKTTWPSREEATRLTMVVIGVIVVLGIYMGILDTVLSLIVKKFSLIK